MSVTHLAEAWLPAGARRNFANANVLRAHHAAVSRWDGQDSRAITHAPQVPFTGKVFIVVCPYAMGADPYIHAEHGTYALCSSRVREFCAAGDVVITVSPPRSSASTRGLQNEQRVVLSVGLIDSTMP